MEEQVIQKLSTIACLDDTVIDFFAEQWISLYNRKDVLWISSLSITNLLQADEQKQIRIINKLGLGKYKENNDIRACFFVLNSDFHWTLLVHFKDCNDFYLYDSLLLDSHKELALQVYRLMIKYKATNKGSKLKRMFTYPQQSSYWECGMYVLITSKILMRKRKIKKLKVDDIENCREYYSLDGCTRAKRLMLDYVVNKKEI